MPYHPPTVSYTPAQPHTLQVAWSVELEPLLTETHMSVAGAQEKDSQSGGRACPEEEQTNSTMHPPSQPPGAGAFGTSTPSPPPTCPYLLAPIGALVDVSWQQRSTEARRESTDYERWMAAAEATGSLTRMLRTKPASFSVPGFFLNLMCCTPFSPFLWEGCPEWGGGFFSLFFFLKRVMGKVLWEAALRCAWVSVQRLSSGVPPSLTRSIP